MPKSISVIDDAVRELLFLKTKELEKALFEQQTALSDLIQAMEKYKDWLEEEVVRLEGEK